MSLTEYTVTAPNAGLIFYGPDPTVTLNITAGASSYTVIDIYGTTVSSGSISSTATSFSPTPPTGGFVNGWYLVQITGASHYAISAFVVINNDSRFPTAPAWGAPITGADYAYFGDDFVAYGISQIGAYRDGCIQQANQPTSQTTTGGFPANAITSIQDRLAFNLSWQTADTVRQPIYIVDFPNGGVDAVQIGNLRFTRRGGHTDAASLTVGPGSSFGYKLTVTDTSTSTVSETHDNCLDEAAIMAAVNAQTDGWLYAWGTHLGTPTQTTTTLGNAYTLGVISVVQGVFAYNACGVTWFSGPSNEPSAGDPAGAAAFISTVHAANASAKALVPELLGAGKGGMADWVAAMQTIGVEPDGVSFHAYNLVDTADLDMMDQMVPPVISAITAAWPNCRIFETEYGDDGDAGWTGAYATITTLTSAVASGTTNVSTLAVSALTSDLPQGSTVKLSNGSDSQGLVTTADAASGSTTISVQPFTASYNYGVGSTLQPSSIYSPYQATRAMPVLAYLESVGIPKEQVYWFYCASHGFGFRSWWKQGDGSLDPIWLAARGFSERVYGRSFKYRQRFSGPLDRMLLALQWTDATDQVWWYWTPGLDTATLKLSVSGSSSLTLHDWAGNEATATVTNGEVTTTVTNLGLYVTAPIGASIAVEDLNGGLIDLGTNMLDSAHNPCVITTSSTVGADQSGNPNHPGVDWLVTGQDPMTADRTGNGQQPWVDSTASFPSTLTFTFDGPTTIDRLLLLGAPPFQRSSTTQFEIQYQAPGSSSWVTAYSYSNPTATTSSMVGGWSVSSIPVSSAYTPYNLAYHFDCQLSPVIVQALRVIIQASSWGNSPGEIWRNATAKAFLRFVGAYCLSAAKKPAILV